MTCRTASKQHKASPRKREVCFVQPNEMVCTKQRSSCPHGGLPAILASICLGISKVPWTFPHHIFKNTSPTVLEEEFPQRTESKSQHSKQEKLKSCSLRWKVGFRFKRRKRCPAESPRRFNLYTGAIMLCNNC